MKHQAIMEDKLLLINSLILTIFVMIVDQMFIHNNLTIFQPLSDQYFDDNAQIKITEKDFKHKIATKTWDKIPVENFNCDHEKCDGNIIYKYNNEYYCYDLTKSKTTFFQLDDDTFYDKKNFVWHDKNFHPIIFEKEVGGAIDAIEATIKSAISKRLANFRFDLNFGSAPAIAPTKAAANT